MYRDAKFPNTFATVSLVSGLLGVRHAFLSRVPFPVGARGGGEGEGETRDEWKPCISDSILGSRLFDWFSRKRDGSIRRLPEHVR